MSNWMKVWLCLLALVVLYYLLPPIAHGETIYAETSANRTTVGTFTVTGTSTPPALLTLSAQQCAGCAYGKNCAISVPAGDGCNTCSQIVWCEDGKWKTHGINSCTLASCNQVFEIENPFKGRK